MLRGKTGIGIHRNKESSTFELASGNGSFRSWIGRVVRCCPLHTALQKEIMTYNLDVCIGHGPPIWRMPK